MGFSLNSQELQEYQPNRYPFLMIDHVTDVEPGKYAKGHKHLSNNEWYFPIHFPGRPNMPGALQLEAMAQMLTVAITTLEGLKGQITHALQHTVRFRKEVLPGESLIIEAYVDSWRRGVCRGHATGTTNGTVACEAEMMITIPEIRAIPAEEMTCRDDTRFDFAVVGAGAAVAWRLVSKGHKVLCVERGPTMDPSHYPTTGPDWELRKRIDYNPVIAERRNRFDYPVDDSRSPIAVCNFNAVGGSTILYSAHFPRFLAADFD